MIELVIILTIGIIFTTTLAIIYRKMLINTKKDISSLSEIIGNQRTTINRMIISFQRFDKKVNELSDESRSFTDNEFS